MQYEQLEIKELSKDLKSMASTSGSTHKIESHITSVCNYILKTAAKNSKYFAHLKGKQDDQTNTLITTALASLYGLALLNQGSQKQTQAHTQIQQRHRFYHDENNAAIILAGNFKIAGFNYKMMSVLLKNFHEGKKTGNEIECIKAAKLAEVLHIARNTLYINLRRLRRSLIKHFKDKGINLNINDFIENCGWRGYRLNKSLIEIMALMDLEG